MLWDRVASTGHDFEVDAYCVTTATKNPNEAFDWVQYLCNKDSGIQLGLIGGTVGGRPDVYGSEELLKFPFRKVFKDVMDARTRQPHYSELASGRG